MVGYGRVCREWIWVGYVWGREWIMGRVWGGGCRESVDMDGVEGVIGYGVGQWIL